MKKFIFGICIVFIIILAVPTLIYAVPNPSGTGQPNASCEESPFHPGRSAVAPGSAFNPDGISGTKYAGEQPQNSNNPKSVSQYDVACYQMSQK
jgi:hypothetical protein